MYMKPAKPRPSANAISVFDIETGSEGELLDIGFYHDGEYSTHPSWINWLQHIIAYEGIVKISVAWAHNGGKFDTVGLVMELFHNWNFYKEIIRRFDTKLSNGAILELNIEFQNGEHLLIRDSFRLFPMSLNKILKSFGLNSKLDVPEHFKSQMQLYKNQHFIDYHAYLKQDCIGLSQALHLFRALVNDISPIGDLPLSLGSLALKVFKTSYLKHKIEMPTRKDIEFCEQAYSGGRTEYFGNGKQTNGVYKSCNYYDINSMYPAAMLSGNFPIGKGAHVKRELYYRADGQLCPGAYLIEYDQLVDIYHY